MNESQETQSVRLLNPSEVAARFGVSLRKLWRMLSMGLIPAPIQLGKRGTRWRDTDVTDYINSL